MESSYSNISTSQGIYKKATIGETISKATFGETTSKASVKSNDKIISQSKDNEIEGFLQVRTKPNHRNSKARKSSFLVSLFCNNLRVRLKVQERILLATKNY